ncbi:unnamed protein product [Natator depressus]
MTQQRLLQYKASEYKKGGKGPLATSPLLSTSCDINEYLKNTELRGVVPGWKKKQTVKYVAANALQKGEWGRTTGCSTIYSLWLTTLPLEARKCKDSHSGGFFF